MRIGEAAAVRVDRQRAAGRRASLGEEVHAFAALGDAERFEHDRRSRREGVVQHDVLKVARPHACHAKGLVTRDPCRLAEGEVLHLGEAHVLGALAEAAHVYRPLRRVVRAVGARQHDRTAGVGDETDVEHGERIDDRPCLEHVLHGERLAPQRLGIERRPLARGDGHLRPLLERGAVTVHVARGDEAEHCRRRAEAVGRLVLAGDRGVATRADADL